MPEYIEALFSLLQGKNAVQACRAMKELAAESEKTNQVYLYMGQLLSMMRNDNSYVRTRGLTLLVYNARWDDEKQLDGAIEELLAHIHDEKPIVARQFIQLLPILAKAKPALRDTILSRLQSADFSAYADSMRPLLQKDAQKALEQMG